MALTGKKFAQTNQSHVRMCLHLDHKTSVVVAVLRATIDVWVASDDKKVINNFFPSKWTIVAKEESVQ